MKIFAYETPLSSVEVSVKIGATQKNGLRHDLPASAFCVKMLVTYEVGDREERHELGRFSTVDQAITAGRCVIDTFLAKHHQAQLRGRQLYAYFVKWGPDLYVDAATGEPVFRGCWYARKRVRQLCGAW